AVERRPGRVAVARAAGTGRRHPRRPERRTAARKPEGSRRHAHAGRDGRHRRVGPRDTNRQPAAQSGLGLCLRHSEEKNMNELESMAAAAGEALKARGETVMVAESACGGLISAALLAVPGASAYYRGGLVLYTYESRRKFLSQDGKDPFEGITPGTE